MGRALTSEVPGDRDRPGVETAPGQLGPQGDDPCAHDIRQTARTRVRPTGSRFEGLEAAFPISAEQALQVLSADPALGRGGRDGPLLGDDVQDGDSVLRHAPDCRRCPDSPVTYQVSPMS